jgi:TPR repeat protein
MLGLGHMFENGWGIQQDIEVAKRWYVKARSAGTKGAAKRLRQIKAGGGVQAESASPQVIGDMQATPVGQLPRATTATEQETPATKKPQAGSNKETSSESDNIADSLLGDAKKYLTPVALLILGLFMGGVVFRWMRGSQRHDSVF